MCVCGGGRNKFFILSFRIFLKKLLKNVINEEDQSSLLTVEFETLQTYLPVCSVIGVA